MTIFEIIVVLTFVIVLTGGTKAGKLGHKSDIIDYDRD